MKQLLKPFSRCWEVPGVGRVGSSRLEFGEAEARWKVTKSRHVIAEGFLRSLSTGSRAAARAGAATRPTRAGTARMCCTCTFGRPLGGQQILGPDICRDHLRSICANVWVSALNVYHDRCSHTESRKLEWRWIKNSFNIYYFFESPLPWFKELLLKCLRKVWPSKKGSDRNLSIKSKHWDTDATDIQLSTAWCDSHITWYDLSLYATTCMWQIL